MTGPVLAAQSWPTNAELIADVARLGYLSITDIIVDPTFGHGVWWKKWWPKALHGSDLDETRSPVGLSIDFRHMPYCDGYADVVALDPPYKLNGTPSKSDNRYGVDVVMSRAERMQLVRDGITEAARVLRPSGILLLKCQDQVNGGKIRWQTYEFTLHAAAVDLALVDRFDHLGTGRPQPARIRADGLPSRQEHAYGRPSTLLVFRKLRSAA